MKIENKVIIVIVTVVILLIITIMSPWFHQWNSNRTGKIEQSYIVNNGVARTQGYEWFYDMYQQIEATRQKVQILKDTPEEKGTKMVLVSMIGEYNAKAKMIETKGKWKADDLPNHLEY